jgi:hypothetical protein
MSRRAARVPVAEIVRATCSRPGTMTLTAGASAAPPLASTATAVFSPPPNSR